jgi:hypothetical protein
MFTPLDAVKAKRLQAKIAGAARGTGTSRIDPVVKGIKTIGAVVNERGIVLARIVDGLRKQVRKSNLSDNSSL